MLQRCCPVRSPGLTQSIASWVDIDLWSDKATTGDRDDRVAQDELSQLRQRAATAEQERDEIKRKANEFVTKKKAEFAAQIAERDAQIAELTRQLAEATEALAALKAANPLQAGQRGELNVVNTFLQVSEVPQGKKKLQRAQTAPVGREDLEELEAEEEEEDVSGEEEPEKAEKVIEDTAPEEKTVKKLLRTLPTLNRIETPEPWDLAALAEGLEAEEAEESLGEECRDLFVVEWQEMVRQESPPVAPVVVQPSISPPSPTLAAAQAFQAPAQPQAPAMVSLLTVPVALAVPGSPPFTPPLSPSNSYPRLLGSVSPTQSPKEMRANVATESSKSTSMRPGALETHQMGANKDASTVPNAANASAVPNPSKPLPRRPQELVRWCVDGTRFESHQERILSPEFQLHFPGQAEPFSFRLVILATQTGGKHGAGFRKAKGRGSIDARQGVRDMLMEDQELKCQSTVPANVANAVFSISMGHGIGRQTNPTPIVHNFVDKTCCPLRNGEEADWDFKQSVDGKGCEISVEVNFLG
eukprot:g13765.t1